MSAGTSTPTLNVALAQVDCVLGDVEENARRAHVAIARAKADGADLVVFPELSLTGYALGLLNDDVALTLDDPIVTGLAEAADGVAVVLGLVEQGRVHVYNSARDLDAARSSTSSDKTAPADLRASGRRASTTARAPRCGRSTRASAAPRCSSATTRGRRRMADIAAHGRCAACSSSVPSSLEADSGTDPAELERDWAELVRFHARFLQTWVVFVNRVGSEAGMTFWGGSRVVDPWGRVVAQAPRGEEAIVHAELDVTAVRRRRRETPAAQGAAPGAHPA